MKTLRIISLALLIVVALFALIGLALPRTWHVERSVVINAPAARIRALISTPRRWAEWSAWSKELDPIARRQMAGPDDGPDAEWSWLGPKLGHGRVKIVSVTSDTIEFIGAVESNEVNVHSRFTFVETEAGTTVTVHDEGTLPPLMGYFKPMVEARLTERFEASLEKLKRVVEAG